MCSPNFPRPIIVPVAVTVALLIACEARSQPTENAVGRAADWPMESLTRKDGKTFHGLLQSERDARIEFIEIVRPPGNPMYLVIHSYAPKSVVKLVRLPDADRDELRRRIEPLLTYKSRARIEAGQLEDVVLRVETTNGTSQHLYDGEFFQLASTADPETTARCVVRIDQIFRAYRQLLPPRIRDAGGLRVLLLGSLDEYRGYIQRLERQGSPPIQGPAFYSASQNLIVAGSDLSQFTEYLRDIRRQHEQLLADYDRYHVQFTRWLAQHELEMRKQGLSRDEIELEKEVRRNAWNREQKGIRDKVAEFNRRNQAKFADVTQRMFQRLYHEAFHAYLENYVYPQRDFDPPRWLNEGLAQLFESGQLDGETLRIDAPHRESLRALQSDLQSNPLRLAELLTARPDAFLVTHASGSSSRHYVYSWGLAYYLTFQQNLLSGSTLDGYLSEESRALDPVARFERLVGQKLDVFERRWRDTMLSLKPRK